VQVCVEDNGIGIAEPRRRDVFRIFKRLHRDEEFGPGSGVGLAIVKKIIESHHGEVTIEDANGGGCVFVLTIPSAGPQGSV
jgi:signal transduction histidine kinase